MRDAFHRVNLLLKNRAIPDKEADVWSAVVVTKIFDIKADDGEETNSSRPLAWNLGVSDGVQRDVYEFSTA